MRTFMPAPKCNLRTVFKKAQGTRRERAKAADDGRARVLLTA
jgi:hypothetical protein